jgi:hypothetical protein
MTEALIAKLHASLCPDKLEAEIVAELRRQAVEIELLRKDAARYRCLRVKHDGKDSLWHVRGSVGAPILSGLLDAAIDAEMDKK